MGAWRRVQFGVGVFGLAHTAVTALLPYNSPVAPHPTTTPPGRGGTHQREMIVATSETPTTPEVGATAGMARWKRGASTRNAPPAGGGAVYGLGMIGALAYFLGSAESGRDYVLALGKAAVWPALLVYRAFKVLDG